MYWEQQIQFASLSDIGFRRRNNQDRCLVNICQDQAEWQRRGHLFLVADGMGGHAVGELASKIAVDTLPHTFYKLKDASVAPALQQAISTANGAIYERSSYNRDFERMGTTCTALVLSPEGAFVGHVGDSRAYRVRGDRIDQLTFDHSLQWELIRQGKMSPEDVYMHQPRNVITRSLGPEDKVEIDVEGPFPIQPGDTFLLCSDGLTGHIADEEIGTVLKAMPPAEACRFLVHLANLRGGSDNITVVVARVGELPRGVKPIAPEPEPLVEPAERLQWWHWFIIWGLAALLVLTVAALLAKKFTAATILLLVTVAGAVGMGAWLWETRPRRMERTAATQISTTGNGGPYRTAPAELDSKLLSQLTAIESELQRTAQEEHWEIDWPRHEAAFAAAQSAVTAKTLPAAFRHYAKAIDVLMAGVHLHRKQMNREAKWGKSKQRASDNGEGMAENSKSA